jgi:hypothetical protein
VKNKSLGLIILATWLSASPARAATFYDYNVDFVLGTGTITGTIQTNCDACILNSNSEITSWSFTASDGTNINSSESTLSISVPGPTNVIQATPTGIFTLSNATSGGSIEFCDSADCFDILNFFHSPPQPLPTFSIRWTESGQTPYEFSTNFPIGGAAPVVQIATLVDIVACSEGNLCVTAPAPTPLPATLPLFAGGLGFVGYLTRRKKRAQAMAAA